MNDKEMAVIEAARRVVNDWDKDGIRPTRNYLLGVELTAAIRALDKPEVRYRVERCGNQWRVFDKRRRCKYLVPGIVAEGMIEQDARDYAAFLNDRCSG